MNIAVGCDHRGFHHKKMLVDFLQQKSCQVTDCGCPGTESSDYPDAAFAVGELVAAGQAEAGILICGSGIGMSIAANKVRGIRAALCFTPDQAVTTRRHNDSNVLCLSGDGLSPVEAVALTEAFLGGKFEGGRHARRVAKITAYEDNHRDRS